jgi:hypothetical protein
VYQRREKGWYRRENTGRWSFYAPTQAMVERQNAAAAARTPAAADAMNRLAPTGRGAGVPARQVPNSGIEPRAQQVANLEREYYARALGQMRAHSGRGGNVGRPARGGGRRR